MLCMTATRGRLVSKVIHSTSQMGARIQPLRSEGPGRGTAGMQLVSEPAAELAEQGVQHCQRPASPESPNVASHTYKHTTERRQTTRRMASHASST